MNDQLMEDFQCIYYAVYYVSKIIKLKNEEKIFLRLYNGWFTYIDMRNTITF